MLSRLTKRTDDGTVVVDPSAMINRLAEYEDSGFAPEDFARVKSNVEGLVAIGADFQHLRDLIKAEREDRLVVRDPYPDKCCATCSKFKRNRRREIDKIDGHLISGTVYMGGVCTEKAKAIRYRGTTTGYRYGDLSSCRLCCGKYAPRGDTPMQYNDLRS